MDGIFLVARFDKSYWLLVLWLVVQCLDILASDMRRCRRFLHSAINHKIQNIRGDTPAVNVKILVSTFPLAYSSWIDDVVLSPDSSVVSRIASRYQYARQKQILL